MSKETKQPEQTVLTVEWHDDQQRIILINRNGDTYTSKSDELKDFLHDAASPQPVEGDLREAAEKYCNKQDFSNPMYRVSAYEGFIAGANYARSLKGDRVYRLLTMIANPAPDDVFYDLVDTAKLALNHLDTVRETPEGEWREVSKELPEKNQHVLLSDNGDMLLDVFRFLPTSITANGFDLFDSKTDRYTPDEVTHWMPLPQPPIR